MTKRILIALLICLMIFTLCSCKEKNSEGSSTVETTDTTKTSETEATTEPEKEENIVETTYLKAISLTKNDLVQKGTSVKDGKSTATWKYKDLPLLFDDSEWINNSINKKGTVNQGAIYRRIAMDLQGFEQNITDYKNFAEWLIGYVPETRDEFVPYAQNAETFIVTSNPLQPIMKAFEQNSNVKGNFDFDGDKYDFSISDLTACANEMKISEDMLGYVLAMLAEYAPDISFNGNSCNIKYESFRPKIEPLEKADFTVKFPSENQTVDMIDTLNSEYGDNSFYYSYYDASVDSSKEGIIETKRGIHIGDSKKAVFTSYGETNENTFSVKNNAIYQILLEEDAALAAIMRIQCSTFVSYECKDVGSIDFYFDENACVSWIIFYNY